MKKAPKKATSPKGLASNMKQGDGKPAASMETGNLNDLMRQGSAKRSSTAVKGLRSLMGQ